MAQVLPLILRALFDSSSWLQDLCAKALQLLEKQLSLGIKAFRASSGPEMAINRSYAMKNTIEIDGNASKKQRKSMETMEIHREAI